MKQIALAAALLSAFAAPALANHHEEGSKAKKCEAGAMSKLSNGACSMVDSMGCTITCSKDGNTITMMRDNMVMVGDKKAGTWTLIKDGKPSAIAKDSKEAKMAAHHMGLLAKK